MAKKSDSLMELMGQYTELIAIADEVDADVLADTIEGLEGEIEVKANGYGFVSQKMKTEIAAQKGRIEYMKSVLKGMQDHLKAMENEQKRFEDRLLATMIATGLDETGIKTEMFDIKVQGIGGVQELWTDTENIPNEFMKTEIVVKPDNDKIREYVKSHDCEWARLLPKGKKVVIK